jgi:hypothetical protein
MRQHQHERDIIMKIYKKHVDITAWFIVATVFIYLAILLSRI